MSCVINKQTDGQLCPSEVGWPDGRRQTSFPRMTRTMCMTSIPGRLASLRDRYNAECLADTFKRSCVLHLLRSWHCRRVPGLCLRSVHALPPVQSCSFVDLRHFLKGCLLEVLANLLICAGRRAWTNFILRCTRNPCMAWPCCADCLHFTEVSHTYLAC